jgi:hypothetical protein
MITELFISQEEKGLKCNANEKAQYRKEKVRKTRKL